jgi:two-component system phosphate regulon sensor histidine kinase PhoR
MPSFLAVLFFLLFAVLWSRYLNQKKKTAEVLREKETLNGRISELLENKEDITEENRYLKNLFDKGPGFVVGLSSAGIVRFANRETVKFFRISEPVGRNYWEMTQNEGLNRLIAQTLQDKQFREEQVEFFMERKLFSIALYPDENGIFLIGHDLTREQQLAWQRREFTANASHELRSPLATLGTALETMRQFLAKEGEDFYEIAGRQVQRLSALAKDLLTLAEVEDALSPHKFEEINLADFAGLFFLDFFREAKKKGIQLSVNLPDELPGVRADKRRLEQVFGNLLDNAFKYTPSGGRIEITGSLSKEEVLIRISDSGVGIPTEDLPRIFERFYRVDKGRSRQLGGTGLGLSIVRHIIEAAGGRVWAESEIDKGSTFFFTLLVW